MNRCLNSDEAAGNIRIVTCRSRAVHRKTGKRIAVAEFNVALIRHDRARSRPQLGQPFGALAVAPDRFLIAVARHQNPVDRHFLHERRDRLVLIHEILADQDGQPADGAHQHRHSIALSGYVDDDARNSRGDHGRLAFLEVGQAQVA